MNTRPQITHTHTVAELAVSSATYNEIAALLRAAEYDHAFDSDGMIDMGGIGLTDNGASKAAGLACAPAHAGYDPRAPLEINWTALRESGRHCSAPDDPGAGGDDRSGEGERHEKTRIGRPAVLCALLAAALLVLLVYSIGQHELIRRGLALFFHLN